MTPLSPLRPGRTHAGCLVSQCFIVSIKMVKEVYRKIFATITMLVSAGVLHVLQETLSYVKSM